MNNATTYDQWKAAAIEADRRSGAARWKQEEETDLYDYKVIRYRLDELRALRASGDPQRLLYYLNEGLHGNMGGMGSASLYRSARFGTKILVTDYVDEVVGALQQLDACAESEVAFKDKLAFFRRAADCHGRSALMLSGAGALGPFHIGVAKALAEQHLLPNVISGSSAGSLIAAITGTHHQAELATRLVAGEFDVFPDAGLPYTGRRRIRIDDLMQLLESWIPDMTFVEALEETGRHINVSVAPVQPHQNPRLLNASTSPDVFIRDAVKASCAIPGIFPAVTLHAKNVAGERVPYVPSRKWVDGSITGDLPARHLGRLYGVNHFIASQTNPIVLWALQDPHNADNLFRRFFSIYQRAGREWLRAIYPTTMRAVRNHYPLNTYTRMWFSVLTQEYTADINILPKRRFYDPRMILSKLSPDETRALVEEGARATWPKIEMIRICTSVSRCIDGILKRLESRYGRQHA